MNHSGLIYTRTRRIRAAGITRARTSAKRKQKSDKVCRPSETGDISISMKRHTKPPMFRDTSIQAIDMRAHTHRRELVRSAGPTFPAMSAIPRTTRAARAVLPHGIRSAEKSPGTLRGTRQQIEKKKRNETKRNTGQNKTKVVFPTQLHISSAALISVGCPALVRSAFRGWWPRSERAANEDRTTTVSETTDKLPSRKPNCPESGANTTAPVNNKLRPPL